jgi:hypothetical protein
LFCPRLLGGIDGDGGKSHSSQSQKWLSGFDSPSMLFFGSSSLWQNVRYRAVLLVDIEFFSKICEMSWSDFYLCS